MNEHRQKIIKYNTIIVSMGKHKKNNQPRVFTSQYEQTNRYQIHRQDDK